jgi:glycosyltransferase involved in cell wall biosynthesis
MTVCVAVVVKDRRDRMAHCLDALEAQTLRPDQLVVVDNGSTDGTLEMLLERGVDVVQAPGPLGAARQVAVDVCRQELLAFTDSDCRPQPEWLSALVAASDDNDVVQGRTVPESPVLRRWAATQHIEAFTDLYECCNLLYRVAALRAAGGFDTRTGFFGEDTAAGWRLRERGGRGAFADAAVVEHDLTYPGAVWHLRRGLMYAAWPRLVREFPAMRGELLYRGFFLNPKQARLVTALVGVAAALSTRRLLPLAAAVPLLRDIAPPRCEGRAMVDSACNVAFDTAVLAGLVLGSVKERRVVL